MANIIILDPREWILQNVVQLLTPKDHDPKQWALAVVDDCEKRGHTLTEDELETIKELSAAPPPVEVMAEDICNPLDQSFVEELAENMAIEAGSTDSESFIPRAKELLRRFQAVEGRMPADYLEIEQWSLKRLDKSGTLLVVK